jgi:hypothetical protein
MMKGRKWISVMFVLALLLGGFSVNPERALALEPNFHTVVEITDVTSGAPVVGSVFTTDVILSVSNHDTSAVGIRGIDLYITYNNTVEVDDANGNPADGIQVIERNEFFGSDMIVAVNKHEVAPNCPGGAPKCIHLALAHTGGDITNHTGRIATIQWAGLTVGEAWMDVLRPATQLSDNDGNKIPVNTVIVPDIAISTPGAVTGSVFRKGASAHDGTVVTAYKVFPGPALATGTTNPDGSFSLLVPVGGPYLIQANYGGYLRAQRNEVYVAGATVNIGSTWLVGGDVNDDDNVNMLDLVAIAEIGAYGTAVGITDPRDINDDLVINIFDLSIAAANYRKTGPTTW